MPRYGAQYGPDITFLGVDRCDLADPASFGDADVVVLGAPFDGGTSHRPGARFGPQAIRMTDYVAQDGSRPSLALRTDGLRDLRVVDTGDVEMFSGDIGTALRALEGAVEAVARSGAIPVVLGGDHSIAFADATGVANVVGHGRVSMLHFDAPYDHADITAALANRVVLEALSGINRRRRDARDGIRWDPSLPLLADRPTPEDLP